MSGGRRVRHWCAASVGEQEKSIVGEFGNAWASSRSVCGDLAARSWKPPCFLRVGRVFGSAAEARKATGGEQRGKLAALQSKLKGLVVLFSQGPKVNDEEDTQERVQFLCRKTSTGYLALSPRDCRTPAVERGERGDERDGENPDFKRMLTKGFAKARNVMVPEQKGHASDHDDGHVVGSRALRSRLQALPQG